MTVRRPAVAGVFYPDEPRELEREVRSLLTKAAEARSGSDKWHKHPAFDATHGTPRDPKAVIVPHAGYTYSGFTAAVAYDLLSLARDVTRVVILGPAHHVPVRGLALLTATEFETPLGNVAVDQDAATQLATLPQVLAYDAAHAREHSLEVQLPFLQMIFPDAAIVPLIVGAADPWTVAEVLATLWGGRETRIVVSSDLSHYLTDAAARAVDADTLDRILRLEPNLEPHDACGAHPINGLLAHAADLGMSVELLYSSTSANASRDTTRVVGYGAVAFWENGKVSEVEPALETRSRSGTTKST